MDNDQLTALWAVQGGGLGFAGGLCMRRVMQSVNGVGWVVYRVQGESRWAESCAV